MSVAFKAADMYCEQWLYVWLATAANSNCEKCLPTHTGQQKDYFFWKLLLININRPIYNCGITSFLILEIYWGGAGLFKGCGTSLYKTHGVITITNRLSAITFSTISTTFCHLQLFSFSSPSFPISGILKINVVLHYAQNIMELS